jgi:Ca-activated chloride channel family protein
MVSLPETMDQLTMLGFPLQFELTRPSWLLGLALVPLVILYFYKSLVDLPKRQRIASSVIRSSIIGLLVLSLAGLTWMTTTRRKYVVFVVDRSLSVGEDSRKAADVFLKNATTGAKLSLADGTEASSYEQPSFLRRLFTGAKSAGSIHTNDGDAVGYLAFAAEPGQFRPGGLTGPAPADEKGSDLAAAIEVAASSIPPGYNPEVVLLSDGNATSGDALKAALRAGVPISTVPLARKTDPEVQVSAVNVPAQVKQGEPFYVEVVIDASADGEGDIEVFRNEHKVISERIKLKKGENRRRFPQTIEQERLAKFTVMTRGFKDTLLDNNSDFGLVFTSGKPRILLIEGDAKSSRDLAWALEEQEMAVDIRPSTGMPDSLTELQNYELLILSNVPATSLSLKQMDVARTYVQDLGGGLIMLGGDQSFGLGGYYKTTLEEILPVRSDFEKEKEKPSLAMMLVIDKSGSMGGDKIEMAKDAAKSAVELLGPNDKVGVIAFDGEPFMVSEMHQCNDKPFVLDRVAGIEAGGGTSMAPAMEQALEELSRVQAKLKHVIILTDGISSPGDFEGIAGSMAQAHITVSTVGIGDGADVATLEQIAKTGLGRHYFTDDPNSIPQIFAKETVAASKSAINEQPFTPLVVRPHRALADLAVSEAPMLLGYVVTRRKPTAEFILSTENGDPLLCWWRYGLGEVVAFTSDARSRWAADWISTWPQFGKFWAQVARHAMRKSEAKGVVMQVSRRDRRATVSLDAILPSGKYLNGAESDLIVIDPHGNNFKLPMTQTAPGRYQAEFDATKPGAYNMEFSQKVQGNLLNRESRGMAVGYPDELRLKDTNTDALRAIAQASGGRYNPPAPSIFQTAGKTAKRALPLWPYLVLAASILFVVDVALRRIDFSLTLGNFLRRISLSRGSV